MAKQRRHQSSKPRRKPVPKQKRRSLKPVANAKLESELYRQVAPGLSINNRKSLKQRMDILAQYKPPEGRTAKVTFDQDTGAAEKTFYTAEGREYDSVKITPQGKISMGAIEWNVAEQGAAGLVNICGTMNVPFAAQAFECVPEDHPLAGCVDESLKSALCCLEGLVVDSDYTLVDPSTQPPECGVNDRLIAGFDGTGWLSPHPNEGARADGVEVRLTCSGGAVSVTEIVGGVETNCFIYEQSQNPFVVKASGNHVGRCGSSPGTIWTL